MDGDEAGNNKIPQLLAVDSAHKPEVIIQWLDGSTVEDIIAWILRADENAIVEELKKRLPHSFSSLNKLIELFKVDSGGRRLKTDYLAYEEIASTIRQNKACLERARKLLDAVSCACLGLQNPSIEKDNIRSTEQTSILRIKP